MPNLQRSCFADETGKCVQYGLLTMPDALGEIGHNTLVSEIQPRALECD
ncbi:hypothetical protein [Caballeronia udeis]|nr:hypothetical protein [Caballeronia udeis]